MIEHFLVPTDLGESQLAHKVCAIEAEGYKIVRIVPDVWIHGGREKGWDIQAENGVKPFVDRFTGQMVTEM